MSNRQRSYNGLQYTFHFFLLLTADHDIGKISDKVADMMKNKSTSEPSSSKTEKSSKSGQAKKPKSKKVATVSITSTDARISSTNLTSRSVRMNMKTEIKLAANLL